MPEVSGQLSVVSRLRGAATRQGGQRAEGRRQHQRSEASQKKERNLPIFTDIYRYLVKLR